MHLDLLSGGAAKGLVDTMQAAFTASTGCALRATFSAVGVMQQKLLAGEPCDVVILTAALIEALARDHHVVAETGVTLGAVPTGFDLATVYSAAVCTRAHEGALARRFVQLLASSDAAAARARAGFE